LEALVNNDFRLETQLIVSSAMKGIDHSLDRTHLRQRIEKHVALDLTIKPDASIVQAFLEIIEGTIFHRSSKWKKRK
jgi:hypothetical protein